jgi:hypothetical protein
VIIRGQNELLEMSNVLFFVTKINCNYSVVAKMMYLFRPAMGIALQPNAPR